jgi:hypothetical protein
VRACEFCGRLHIPGFAPSREVDRQIGKAISTNDPYLLAPELVAQGLQHAVKFLNLVRCDFRQLDIPIFPPTRRKKVFSKLSAHGLAAWAARVYSLISTPPKHGIAKRPVPAILRHQEY